MLIYAKRDSRPHCETNGGTRSPSETPTSPKPSHRALEVVNRLNDAHDTACSAYRDRWVSINLGFLSRLNNPASEKAALTRFVDLRMTLRGIYSEWGCQPSTVRHLCHDTWYLLIVCNTGFSGCWPGSTRIVAINSLHRGGIETGWRHLFIRRDPRFWQHVTSSGHSHGFQFWHCLRTWASRSDAI